MLDEPGDGFRLLGVEAEPGRELARDAGAEYRMVAAAALGDVVQEQREIKHLARQHFMDDFGRQRQLLGQRALLDPRQHADREDRVFVHRIDVIHVVLGLRDDPSERRDEAAEHPRLVEAAQRGLRVLFAGEHGDEQAVRLRVGAQPRVDARQVPGDQPQRAGVDVQPPQLRDMEQPQHVDRAALEGVVVGDVEAPVVEPEPLDVAPGQARQRDAEERAADMLRLDGGAEDAGQVADRLGDEIVMLHEALDAAGARPAGVARHRGDGDLAVERQALLGAPGQVVQVAAHGPQMAVGAAEHAELRFRQRAARHQVAHILDAVEILGDPEQRMEVAQAPLAVLDVGFDDVARIAHAAVARVALRQFGGDEGPPAGGGVLAETPPQLEPERLVTVDVARLQQRGADGDVAAGAGDGFVHRTGRLAHRQAEVPQHVEDIFDDLLAARGGLVRGEEQQVDVGPGREFAAPIAADGDEREAVGRGGVGFGEHPFGGVVEQRGDEAVGEP